MLFGRSALRSRHIFDGAKRMATCPMLRDGGSRLVAVEGFHLSFFTLGTTWIAARLTNDISSATVISKLLAAWLTQHNEHALLN